MRKAPARKIYMKQNYWPKFWSCSEKCWVHAHTQSIALIASSRAAQRQVIIVLNNKRSRHLGHTFYGRPTFCWLDIEMMSHCVSMCCYKTSDVSLRSDSTQLWWFCTWIINTRGLYYIITLQYETNTSRLCYGRRSFLFYSGEKYKETYEIRILWQS